MIGQAAERVLDALLRRSPAQPLFVWRASRHLVVLAYHDVRDAGNFARQVEWIAREMHPISLDELTGALARREGLPRRAVLVTFDDGDRTVYERALPVLRAWGVPAVVFVIAGLLDTHEPFWWSEVEALTRRGAVAAGLGAPTPAARVRAMKRMPDERRLRVITELRRSAPGGATETPQLRRFELRSLEAAGVAIGNHTLTHPCLERCADQKLTAELIRAHEVLTDALGAAPTAFAYPNGDLDPRAERVLQTMGYEAAFLFDHRIGPFPPAHPLRISRVRVGSTTSWDRFRIILSGLHPALHHAIGRP